MAASKTRLRKTQDVLLIAKTDRARAELEKTSYQRVYDAGATFITTFGNDALLVKTPDPERLRRSLGDVVSVYVRNDRRLGALLTRRSDLQTPIALLRLPITPREPGEKERRAMEAAIAAMKHDCSV